MVQTAWKTEYRVGISISGATTSVQRLLPDSLAGAELGTEEAVKIAQVALRDYFATDVEDTVSFKRIKARSDKWVNRLDHTFVWERTSAKVDSAEFRVNAVVQGDRFGGAFFSFKAPESFMRDLREKRMKDTVLSILQGIAAFALVVLGSTTFFKLYREGAISWRIPTFVTLLMAAGYLINVVNTLPLFYQGFRTSQSMITFLGNKAIGFFVSLALAPLLMGVVAALAVVLYRRCLPDQPGPGEWVGCLKRNSEAGQLLIDSFLSGAGLYLIFQAIAGIRVGVKHDYFMKYATANGYSMPGMEIFVPFFDAVSALSKGVGGFFVLVAIALVVQRYVKNWKWVLVLLLLQPIISQMKMAQDWTNGLVIVGITIVQCLAGVAFVVKVVRFNLLAYFIAYQFVPMVYTGLRMMDSSVVWYDANGAAVILLGLLPLLVGIYWVVRSRQKTAV